MANKCFLPCWLVFLAILIGLPTTRYATSHALPAASILQNAAKPVTGLPDPLLVNRLPSHRETQPLDSSARPNLRFDCLTAADGLSFSLAMTILQDQRGFMWFGTRYGLDKYDGDKFTVYLPAPEGNVLAGNYVYELNQDPGGDMWIATSIDLVRRDMQRGEFVHYLSDPADPESLNPGRIFALGRNAGGALLVGTETGLSRYNPATDDFSRYLADEPVVAIYTDRKGGIWLGTANGVLYYSSGSLEQPDPVRYPVEPSDPEIPGSNLATAIDEDRQGTLWAGTNGGGLARLDRPAGKFIPFESKDNLGAAAELSSQQVWSILEDGAGRLWVGTMNGLFLLDPTRGNVTQYRPVPGDARSLINNVITDLYLDRSGVVWIATLAGICKVNETASHFTHYEGGPGEPGNASQLSENIILSVYQDSHGSLWVGTLSGGLNRMDGETGEVTVYRHDPNDPNSLSPGDVTATLEDSTGKLWIGTSSGLNRFDPETETFESEPDLNWNSVGAIVEDQKGNLWVAGWDGLYRRKAGETKFSLVLLDSGLTEISRNGRLMLDSTGALWIASQTAGLVRLDHAAEAGPAYKTIQFPQKAYDPRSPGGSPVMDIYEDANGTIWIGTVSDGLARYDRETNTFAHFIPNPGGDRDEALSRYVGCIEGDAQGYLWMSTILGLARFDPRNKTFTYYDARDGLTIGEGISCARGRNGEMFFGSWQGLNSFYPDQIRDNPNPPPVVITAVNLRDKALRTDLQPGEQIRLPYQENYLSFDYAALDYAAPAKNQYAYKMEGLDPEWVEAGTRRHADYPDLKAGSYTFRVKASNGSGVWNEEGAAVQITITPPFWQTWWFLGLAGLALAGVVAGGVRLRLRSVEMRSRELEKQVYERTGALEQKTLETERRRQELEALLSADERMQHYLHEDQVLQALVDVAVEILKAEKSAVFLWDEKREQLAARVARGFRSAAIWQLRFRRGVGLAAETAVSGEPTLVEDSLIDPRREAEDPENVQFSVDEGLRSFMFFPIRTGDEILGIFNVSYDEPRAVGAEELRLFHALTQRAALHIENARLYEQSQEVAVLEERSRLARELHDAVTQTLFSASLVAEALPATWEKIRRRARTAARAARSEQGGAGRDALLASRAAPGSPG